MANQSKIKRLVVISFLTAILFIQEQILSGIPNVQLTFLLIILYSKCFKLHESILMITVHVILDNILMGTFNLYVLPFMYVGYLIIPLTLKTIFKNVEKPLTLGLISILYSFIYSWLFIIPNVILIKSPFVAYWLADIPFEIILSVSSFITVLWLYQPLEDVINSFIDSPYHEKIIEGD